MIEANPCRFAAILCVLVLAACGKHAANQGAENPAATVTGTVSTAPAPAASLTRQKAPAASSAESSLITRVNEDGSETVEDTANDNSARNPLLAAVAASLASPAAAATTAAPTPWQEGVNYTRLVPAQPTAVPAGQVEVLEFFWYACPHCYAMDPLIEAWKKTKPPYVTFVRVPIMWQDGHRSLARLFYALDSMGKLNDLHNAIFTEIHVNRNPLVDPGNDAQRSEDLQTAFVVKQGVPAAAFKTAYHSFAVETSLQRADQLWQRYHIAGVPTFVVNGKFIADQAMAQGEERLIALVGDLAALEHKR